MVRRILVPVLGKVQLAAPRFNLTQPHLKSPPPTPKGDQKRPVAGTAGIRHLATDSLSGPGNTTQGS